MLTDATLAVIAGAVLSVLAAYIPNFNVWYQSQNNTTKRLLMATAMFLVAGTLFSAGCAGLELPFPVACTQDSAVGLGLTFLAALIANQSTYDILPVSPAVKALKAAQKADPILALAEKQ